jgi:hypothetical protein
VTLEETAKLDRKLRLFMSTKISNMEMGDVVEELGKDNLRSDTRG